jgi:signal transduction histidine kinase
MNRLWVRLSIVIACVVIFVALFPITLRRIIPSSDGLRKPISADLSAEQIAEIQEGAENRVWTSVTQTLLVGALFGLAAGVVVSHWLVAPLQKMEEGARAVAEHQLQHRVPVQGSEEMQSVARSFNQMAEELEHQETLRKKMLADVTHELRHPSHILQGNLRAILDGVFPLEMKEIARLLEQTHQLTTLVEDLHQLALAEARQLPLNKQETDLGSLISNTLDVSQSMLTGKGISLQSNIPSTPIIREIDGVRIRQVFQNLLNNAFHHTSQGGAIIVNLLEQEGGVKISVQDTGVGILLEHLPHIFDRFYRADTSLSRDDKGTGLGLAIAQAIIQAHDGDIAVFSAGAGQGSTFTITLP